jgi:hypothetical protein
MKSADSFQTKPWHPQFWFAQPNSPRRKDALLELERSDGSTPALLQLPNAPADLYNARLPAESLHLKRELRDLCAVPRMSTFTVSALINRIVASMPHDRAFVNVGVWNGFTFLSGLTANPDRTCVGIDDFSQFGGPREAFLDRFERARSDRHSFHELDYREYFSTLHRDPIRLYLYDGEHSYENQLQGLESAERFLEAGSIVLVDDTNWEEPRQATLDFVRKGRLEYELLFDVRTASNAHPTLWNGLMAIRATGQRSRGAALLDPVATSPTERPARVPAESPGPDRRPRVSIVVYDDRGDTERLGIAIDGALAQHWDDLEVLVVEESGKEPCRRLIADYGNRLKAITAPAGGGLVEALETSDGELVAFTDAGVALRPSAVKLALGFPRLVQFFRQLDERGYEEGERALEAADEIAAAVPPLVRIAVIAERTRIPRTLGAERLLRFGVGGTRPDGDEEAIAELERLRGLGVGAIAVLWPAFEWLDRCPALYDHLTSRHTRLIENERVKVFGIGEK